MISDEIYLRSLRERNVCVSTCMRVCVTDGCFDFNVIALFPNALESDRLFRVHGETDEAEDDGAKMRKQKIKIKRRQKGDWLEFAEGSGQLTLSMCSILCLVMI